jgi:uncharacterized membrane protein
MAVLFIVAGIFHFTKTSTYLKIVPPHMPYHLAVVYISGVLEILFGIGLFFGKFRHYSALGLIILLIAIFPANIYMLTSGLFTTIPRWVLWMRLPLQAILIAWAAWFL